MFVSKISERLGSSFLLDYDVFYVEEDDVV